MNRWGVFAGIAAVAAVAFVIYLVADSGDSEQNSAALGGTSADEVAPPPQVPEGSPKPKFGVQKGGPSEATGSLRPITAPEQNTEAQAEKLAADLEGDDTIPVIVGLDVPVTPEGNLPPLQQRKQRSRVAGARRAALDAVP